MKTLFKSIRFIFLATVVTVVGATLLVEHRFGPLTRANHSRVIAVKTPACSATDVQGTDNNHPATDLLTKCVDKEIPPAPPAPPSLTKDDVQQVVNDALKVNRP